jgi:hypothetical protein
MAKPKPSDDDRRGGRRASRREGKPGRTKSTWTSRNLETGKSALLDSTDDVDPKTGSARKTFRIIGRNNPN